MESLELPVTSWPEIKREEGHAKEGDSHVSADKKEEWMPGGELTRGASN